MRRRLWWSLVMFDNRLCEMSHHGSTSLLPTWQCRPVLNVNDADLLPDSMLAPEAYKRPTEAIFVVVRSEICDFVRQSTFHLSFTNPTLMPLAQDAHQSEGERRTRLLEFEERIESQYLSKCNPERALDCMTIWSTRTLLARLHVLQYYAASAQSSAQATESQRDGAVWYAVKMIECDTQLAQAPHVNGFRWHVHMHFPAPAYIHIVQDLRKRPVQKHARRCWDVMSENYVARLKEMHVGMSPFLRILSNSLSRAWEGYVAALPQGEEFPAVPPIIEHVKRSMGARDRTTRSMKSGMESMTAVGITDNWIPNNANLDMPPLRTATPPHNIMGFETLPGVAGSDDTDLDLSQFDLSTMDWNPLLALGGSHMQ